MEEEKLVRTTVFLEEEAIEALDELAREFASETGKEWSRSAVVRLALGDFFTRRGRML